MALVEDARSALFLAELIEIVRACGIAVHLGRVRGVRQGVAHRDPTPLALPPRHGLQRVVVGLAQVHDGVDRAEAVVHRHDRPGGVGGGSGAYLAGRGAHEQRRRVQVDGAIEVGDMLLHVVGRHEHAPHQLAFRADRGDLAFGIHERVGIAGEATDVEKAGIVGRLTGTNRHVARRQHRAGGKRNRHGGNRGREPGLSGRGGVGELSFRAAEREVRVGVGAQHRGVETVAAAHRSAGVAAGMPAEAGARLEVLLAVAEGLPVVAEAEIDRQVGPQSKAVLHEQRVDPLPRGVGRDAEVERLRVPGRVANRQLVDRHPDRRVDLKLSERERPAELGAVAARGVTRQAAADPQEVRTARRRQRVRQGRLMAPHV